MNIPTMRQRGVAAVELALLLPMLVVLLLCTIDGARALQAKIIMTNVAREGANLVARGNYDLDVSSQEVIGAVMASAPPLNVDRQGMMYITRVMGVPSGATTKSVVLDQFRWDNGSSQGFSASKYAPASQVYACASWKTAKCASISSTSRPSVAIMTGKLDDGEVVYVVESFYKLDDGEVVYVVESFYKFDMMVSAFSMGANVLPAFGPDLYSMSLF